MKRFLVLNGPNINFTGIREVGVYGAETFESILGYIRKEAERLGCEVTFFQSNHEGALIDKIHASRTDYDGVVLNAGAYTHYSYAMRDAIEAVQDFTPYVEVHMSDIHQREDFRRISVLTPVCVTQICGFGKDSYKMGLDLLLEIL